MHEPPQNKYIYSGGRILTTTISSNGKNTNLIPLTKYKAFNLTTEGGGLYFGDDWWLFWGELMIIVGTGWTCIAYFYGRQYGVARCEVVEGKAWFI